jgi:phosphoribosylformylglycinamidine (FGAM) synthase-like enzyme
MVETATEEHRRTHFEVLWSEACCVKLAERLLAMCGREQRERPEHVAVRPCDTLG